MRKDMNMGDQKTNIVGGPQDPEAMERRSGTQEMASQETPDENQEAPAEEPETEGTIGSLTLESGLVGKMESPKEGEPISVIVQGTILSEDRGTYVMSIHKMDRVPGNPPPLGSGERFHKLEETLSHKSGVTDPGALAASIGRKKYGKARFQGMAARGR